MKDSAYFLHPHHLLQTFSFCSPAISAFLSSRSFKLNFFSTSVRRNCTEHDTEPRAFCHGFYLVEGFSESRNMRPQEHHVAWFFKDNFVVAID